MNITLIHDWLTGMRGGERCLEVACRHFADARLFTLLHRRHATSDAIERMRITKSFLQRIPAIFSCYRYCLPLMPAAIESLRVPTDTNLVLSFSHAVAKGIVPPDGVPHVCYCFTPMRYAWHLHDDYFGDAHSGDGKFHRLRRARRAMIRPVTVARDGALERIRQWDRRTSQRVTHFIASSQTVARRIRECYDRDSIVIYPPVDTEYYSPIMAPRDDFYLCVSALVPYKRIDLAIDACNRLGRRLIVIGRGPLLRRLRRLAGPTVSVLGWQSNEVIRDHYRRCRALLFPGHEDFGIVPVEAQACGAPVIAYGRGGASETVIPTTQSDTGTGQLFAEQSVAGLIDGIREFESAPHRYSPTLARDNTERFATGNYERQLIAFVEQVVASRQPALTHPAEPRELNFAA